MKALIHGMTGRQRRAASRSTRQWVVASLLGISGSWSYGQAINDVPMAVKNNVPPNFMFMVDSSGSMGNIVEAAPYSATTTYLSSCPAATTGSNNIVIPATGTLVNIVITSGVPYAQIAGVNRRHTTVASTGNRVCFINSATYPAQLVTTASIGDTTGSYTGNFLNWYFGNFGGGTTGWPSSGIKPLSPSGTAKSRWDVATAATISVINGLPAVAAGATAKVRVGVSTYAAGGNGGGQLRVAMQDLTTTAKTTITGTTIPGFSAPSGYTPLATTLADIGRYMSTGYNGSVTLPSGTSVNIDTLLKKSGTDATTPTNACLAGAPSCTSTSSAKPIQQWCQRSYAFLVTDGRPTYDRSFNNNSYIRDYDGDCSGALSSNCVSNGAAGAWDRKLNRTYEVISGTTVGSDYLDDVAKVLFDIDLRPDLLSPLLNPADPNSTARRPKKNNLLTYTIGFADEAVRSDPLLTATAANGGGLFLNAADEAGLSTALSQVITDAFAKDAAASAVAVANAQITLNNTGYASSYNSGSWYGDLVAYALNTTTALQAGADVWSLRNNLDAQTSATRKIVSWNGSAGLAFTSTNFAGTPVSLTAGVIDYIRGSRTGEGSTYRARQHLLGDIVNAEPVVVTYGSGIPIIFQGANDGMLHAVDGQLGAASATSGQELWAYVPRLVHNNLASLSSLSYAHQYYVDATPAAADIVGFTPTKILVGGLGKGGRGYYALDISSYAAATEAAAASKVLWEFTHANMGYSFGTPLIVNTSAGYRVLLPSGYDNGSATGGDGKGYVWVLNPQTGSVVATLATGSGSSASPSGLAHISRLANSAQTDVVRYVFGADLDGKVWRFDLDNNSATQIALLTDGTGASQPVTSPPEVSLVSGSATKFVVMVGTGRYLADVDVPGNAGANAWATQRQTMYGIFDDTTLSSPTLANIRGSNGSTCPTGGGTADFVCQSFSYVVASNTYRATTNAVNPASRRGWYIDLPADSSLTNGRVTGKPSITRSGTLIFTANVPTNVVCDPGGSSWFFSLNGATGGAVAVNTGGNTYYDAGQFLANALASRPVPVQTANGMRALVRLSDKTVQAPVVPEPASTAAAWRRIYFRSVP